MREDVTEETVVPQPAVSASEPPPPGPSDSSEAHSASSDATPPSTEPSSEPTPASAAEYLSALLERLITLVPTAVEQEQPESIYHARTTSRRLSAGLGLLSPLLPRHSKALRRLIKAVRKTRKTLGSARDEVVMRDRLEKLTLETETRAAAEFVLGYLVPVPTDEPRPTARASARSRKLVASLEKGREVIAAVSNLDTQTITLHAASALKERWLAFGTLAELQSVSGVGVDPHELRLAGKEARYAMELAAAQGLDVAPDLLKRMKQLQDDLGAWHDHYVLAGAIIDRSGAAMSLSRPHTAALALNSAAESLNSAAADLADFARHYDKHAKTLDSWLTLATSPRLPDEPLPTST